MSITPLVARAVSLVTLIAAFVAGFGSVGDSARAIVPSFETPDTAFPKLERIVGGKDTSISSVPWQAWVFQVTDPVTGGGKACGGSLISLWVVVTAAHCVTADDGTVSNDIWVFAGMGDRRRPGSNYRHATMVYRHPGYVDGDVVNDIAVVTVVSDFLTTSSIRPIALPFDENPAIWPADGTPITISGFGLTSTHAHNLPNILQSAKISTLGDPLDASSCRLWSEAGQYDPSQNLCAGSPRDGRDICQGDSGGPYAVKNNGVWTLAGVTSFNSSEGCGLADLPAQAVRVTSFLNWITIAPPNDVSWSYAGDVATITWSARGITAADNTHRYRIEVSTNHGGTWSYAATVNGWITTTSLTCPVGTACIYRVAPTNIWLNDDTAASPVSRYDGPYRFVTVPSAPTKLTVAATSATSITVKWKAPQRSNESAITGYQVFWSTSENGTYTAISGGTSLSMTKTFTKPASGKLFYVVRARNSVDLPGSDDFGGYSNVVAAR